MMKLRFHIGLLVLMFVSSNTQSQIDSLAKNLIDSVKSKLLDDDIPQKTFKDRFMYPHRWYVKQLLAPQTPYYDTNYIRSNKRKLTLTIPVVKKFYGFNFTDLSTKNTLMFSPNNYYYVGFNFSNIILTFGFYPGIKFGAKPDKGNTSGKDVQLTVVGRRVITDVNFQRYAGFYVFNRKDYDITVQNPDLVFIRPDIHVFSFGVNTMFVFNFRKYSLRGAFSFSDVQRKSAGSFMLGLYHSYMLFNSTDSSIVNTPLQPSMSPELYDINRISLITIGLSVGHGYTYVYKKIIVSAVLNLGAGGQKTNYTTLDSAGHTLSLNPTLHLNAKGSIRYDNQKFFFGFMSTYDNNYSLNPTLFNTSNYISKIMFFSGYRFNIKKNGRKLLKAMGLVDYN
ncbi:MAG: DUF4421 family protein [bacterium]|nr:DUF4421 family protein [bacterium]